MLNRTKTIVACLFVVLIVGGCGASSQESFVPSDDSGRQALETALSAWQNGKPMERIESQGTAAVQPQDSDWQKGAKLTSYTIEKELPSTEGPKQFAVRITLQGEPKPIDTVYFVVGRDPLWVFRDRDYERMTGK